MKKDFKVGLVYINTNNIGDIVIYDNVKYITERILDEASVHNYKIIPIDMGEKNIKDVKYKKEYKDIQREAYKGYDENIIRWKESREHAYFMEYEVPKIEYLDMIIFVGGGLLKHHHQFFYAYIDEITAIADNYRIPVVFNAVGVEKVDKNDYRYHILRNAINRACVKAVSTRDDIDSLKNNYIHNNAIRTSRVCDPALWSKETYNYEPGINERKKIGIGVIRPEIFELYDNKLKVDVIKNFYRSIALELERRKIPYEFFTNGGKRDFAFIDDIRKSLGDAALSSSLGSVAKVPADGYQLVSLIDTYKSTISSRMHASIIAYTLGIPSRSLFWNIKQSHFAKITKQPESIIYISQDNEINSIVDDLLSASKVPIDNKYKRSVYKYLDGEIRKCYKTRFKLKMYRFLKAKRSQVKRRLSA